MEFIECIDGEIRIREATKKGYTIANVGDSINLEQPNSKTRRGRVGHQIAQTLTCSCNQAVIIKGVDIKMEDNKLKQIGGIGERNFGNSFREGNRVYDGNYISATLKASPIGNAGGFSSLYKINKGVFGMKEFTNSQLKKLNFNMKPVKIFDSFAGIGALVNAHRFLGVPYEVVGISDIDVDAIISYAAVNIEGFSNIDFEYPSVEEMKEYLIKIGVGFDFTKNKSSIQHIKKDKLMKVYKACILLNNYGDISKINYEALPDFDLFNFSFPCTDISNSGKQKGFKNEDGTPTRSGLVKYGIDLIKVKRPKYIMIENVKALIQKKFIEDFYDIVNEIGSYGYKCYYPTKDDNVTPCVLNSKNYGIPQNRERIFVICVRNDINDKIDRFWEGKDFGFRLKDFLEEEVDEKYYLSEEIQKRFKLNGNNDIERNELNVVGTSDPNKKIGQRDITYGINGIMSTLTATDYKQPKQILDTMQGGNRQPMIITEGRVNSSQDGQVFNTNGISQCLTSGHGNCPKIICEQRSDEGLRFFKDNICGTIRSNDAGGHKCVIENNINISDKIEGSYYQTSHVINNYKIRKLTPKECWRLMGFTDEQFNRAKDIGISDSQLYKQAGNSIVVNVLYYIFKELYKNYIVC